MSMTHLGDRFDIHTGGVDNIFPHHEAEIAQSECAVGHRVVGFWMHAQHLTLSGVRMAKSAGNLVRVTDLGSDGYDPLAFRYLALQARYRRRMTFSLEGVRGADRALRQLRERVAEWIDGPRGDEAGYRERFLAAVNDDLDLPNAMAVTAELVRSDLPAGSKARLLLDFDRVFALDLDREVRDRELPPGASPLLAARERARAARDWQVSDRLRDELAGLGVAVIDSPEGQRWKRLSPRPSASD
jgi:cysteinyl-tRNA synthetase